jgi:RNA polymerase sigma-70 factor, ECF subfamily
MTGLQMPQMPVPKLPDPDLLWSEYRPRLIVFARTFGGDAAAFPEDTAHEIIERAIGHLHLFDGSHAFSTWLYRLARNHCIDVNQRMRRRREIFRGNASELASAHRSPRGPDEQLDRAETVAEIGAALAHLPPDDRQIAFLRYFEELPVATIGEVMGMPTGTVKYRLHVMLERLRRTLEEDHS